MMAIINTSVHAIRTNQKKRKGQWQTREGEKRAEKQQNFNLSSQTQQQKYMLTDTHTHTDTDDDGTHGNGYTNYIYIERKTVLKYIQVCYAAFELLWILFYLSLSLFPLLIFHIL